MSSHLLPRPPAFSRLRPVVPVYAMKLGPEAAELGEGLGPGEILAAKDGAGADDRYFLHRGVDGTATFLKVVPADHLAKQHAADRVACWLGDRGVPVSRLRPGFPRVLSNGDALLAFPYVPARFADATRADMRRLGAGLAATHAALASLPGADEIRRDSARRTEMLRRRVDLVCSGSAAGPHPQLLGRIFAADGDLLETLVEAGNSQAIHGDLVYGNVLFPLDGSAPVILDFEDTQISWAPPGLDLALALERFVLVAAPDDRQALGLGRKFLAAYAITSAAAAAEARFPLARCLRFLSLRSLATLAEMEAVGAPVAVAEWEKFFWLYQQAIERAPLLERLGRDSRGGEAGG